MDKNTIIGFVLILLMLVGYQVLFPAPEPPQPIQKQVVTSQPLSQTAPPQLSDNSIKDTTLAVSELNIETKDLKVTFTNKGGVIKDVLLKNYKTYDKKPLYLVKEGHNQFKITVPAANGLLDLSDLIYSTSSTSSVISGKDSVQVIFKKDLGPNQAVEQIYTLHGEGFLIDYDIKLNGIGLSDKPAVFNWTNQMLQLENDMAENRKAVTINYHTDSFNSPTIGSNIDEKAEKDAEWFTFKSKYFLSGLIAKTTHLQHLEVKANTNESDTVVVKTVSAAAQLPTTALQQGKGNFQFFFGPNDYHVVKKVAAADFEENVNLGYVVLKPINKFVLVPLFNFLEKFVSNYGLLIILLVVFVKLLLTPLTYKSYISMAKMRLLAPELEVIKSKNPDDMAKQQQDQMALYRQVGVSPFSGCIPVLATMPILLSLFFLFPNLIELRQQSFLWSNDLSTYDSIVKLPFSIPFYGNHVSLFTILMTASSIAYAYYNNQMTPTQSGPINMKFMSYIMPLMFMFILNSFPAGLTFYYFVSNIVTIIQQLVIRRFVNEDKIRAVLDENKKKNADKPKQQSKFQKYLEKSLQAAEESRKKQEALEKEKNRTKKK